MVQPRERMPREHASWVGQGIPMPIRKRRNIDITKMDTFEPTPVDRLAHEIRRKLKALPAHADSERWQSMAERRALETMVETQTAVGNAVVQSLGAHVRSLHESPPIIPQPRCKYLGGPLTQSRPSIPRLEDVREPTLFGWLRQTDAWVWITTFVRTLAR